MCNFSFLLIVLIAKIKFFKKLSFFFFNVMQFCVTVNLDPKIIVGHIVRNIYANFQANLRHGLPTSHIITLIRNSGMHSLTALTVLI
jgi:hypothetical protein